MELTSNETIETKEPKVFISYSWTTQLHKDRVKEWADRLQSDGVEVIIDIYDLKGGQDKYAFMEMLVNDDDVTNVLMFCDRGYVEKANDRNRGVGTEAQIISKEIYESVDQTKFIPIVCEFRDSDTPFLPTFLQTRMYFDFSSPEKENRNWEGLVRHLYGKPEYEKPELGEPPSYLSVTSAVATSALSKFNQLRQAFFNVDSIVSLNRQEFLDACIESADKLRVRERPKVEKLGEKILEDCRKLTVVRDHVVDWVLLEANVAPSPGFSEALVDLLENLGELSARPAELNSWNDAWFEAHRLFAYETFLYLIASLMKARAYEDLNNLFTSHFLLTSTEWDSSRRFTRFDGFWTKSDQLSQTLSSGGTTYICPAAEVIKRQANRADIPFSDLIQADLLAMLMSFIPPSTKWYPQLMLYSRYGDEFLFFIRASQHKHFANLATITGIADANELRAKVKEGLVKLTEMGWHNFTRGRSPDFWRALNMENLDTLE